MFTVPMKLHEVTCSTEVMFSLKGNNKAEIVFILIFMTEDFWKSSQGQNCDFFVLPDAKVLLLLPQMIQMCQQIKSVFVVRSVRQQTSNLRKPLQMPAREQQACRKDAHTQRKDERQRKKMKWHLEQYRLVTVGDCYCQGYFLVFVKWCKHCKILVISKLVFHRCRSDIIILRD